MLPNSNPTRNLLIGKIKDSKLKPNHARKNKIFRIRFIYKYQCGVRGALQRVAAPRSRRRNSDEVVDITRGHRLLLPELPPVEDLFVLNTFRTACAPPPPGRRCRRRREFQSFSQKCNPLE